MPVIIIFGDSLRRSWMSRLHLRPARSAAGNDSEARQRSRRLSEETARTVAPSDAQGSVNPVESEREPAQGVFSAQRKDFSAADGMLFDQAPARFAHRRSRLSHLNSREQLICRCGAGTSTPAEIARTGADQSTRKDADQAGQELFGCEIISSTSTRMSICTKNLA